MGVRAYLVKKVKIENKDNEIIIKRILENKPTFNLNKHEKILKLIQDINGDNTNEDLIGELIIDQISWSKIINKIHLEEYTKNELKIIKKISNDLKNEKIRYYECF